MLHFAVMCLALAAATSKKSFVLGDTQVLPCQRDSGRLVYRSLSHPRIYSKARLTQDVAMHSFGTSDVASLVHNIHACAAAADNAPTLPKSPFKNTTTPMYFVVSYGGSGSKTLSGFLNQYATQYHVHDPHPPRLLRMPVKTHTDRAMSTSLHIVPEEDLDRFRVVVVFRDPCDMVCTHGGLGINKDHCQNLLIDPATCNHNFSKLAEFASSGQDFLRLNEFYAAWLDPQAAARRNYNIVVLNFHKMFYHPQRVCEALRLPRDCAQTLPHFNMHLPSSKSENMERRCFFDDFYRIYKNVTDDIYFRLPPVSFLGPDFPAPHTPAL